MNTLHCEKYEDMSMTIVLVHHNFYTVRILQEYFSSHNITILGIRLMYSKLPSESPLLNDPDGGVEILE